MTGSVARTLTGGCQCGAVRYEIAEAPLEVYVCHCRECRKQSASAFGISVSVARDALRLTQGQVRSWRRPAARGGTLECLFCPVCGSRLWHETPGEGIRSVKGGSLDQPPDLSTAIHIWTVRRLPGVIIPNGVPQFAGEPD